MKKLKLPAALLLIAAMLLSFALTASAADGAPIAKNLELSTYRGVSVGGRLSATDPEGSKVTYEITTPPIKGTLDLDDNGHFVYTPDSGKRGKDYFGYKAIDASGNRSQEATVIIKIQKPESKVCYADLEGQSCGYAAQRLAEEEIFVGECLAGDYVFSPDAPVTRSEFLIMCMKVAGTEPLAGVRTTGFEDDREISVWAKPYVSAALDRGIIAGYYEDDSAAVFGPQQVISAAEAAVILDRAMELTDAVPTWYSLDPGVPVWAAQAAANVSSCGLLPDGCSFSDSTLSRADAAELLCGALDIAAKR